MAEYKGFVFAIMFILFFSALVTMIPTGLYGAGEEPDLVTPVEPILLAGFSVSENWTAGDLVETNPQYQYSLGGWDWYFYHRATGSIELGSKIYWGGFLHLGQLDSQEFISPSGENKGYSITCDDLDEDADNGTVRYDLYSISSGNSFGAMVFYWNTSEYSDSQDAFDNDELYYLHGMGFNEQATNNIGFLLVSLLFFQVPDVPAEINVFLITPTWASIIYILWYIIKEMIPFV
jgi:hypothetical protein